MTAAPLKHVPWMIAVLALTGLSSYPRSHDRGPIEAMPSLAARGRLLISAIRGHMTAAPLKPIAQCEHKKTRPPLSAVT